MKKTLNIKFSLIIGTLNRSEKLKQCLNFIARQSYTNFEVIVIDQSDDDTTAEMLNDRQYPFPLVYRKMKIKGLSKARNVALRIMTGNYLCLIDDDGEYGTDYLKNASTEIDHVNEKTILIGNIWNTITNKPFIDYSQLRPKKDLSLRQVIRLCPSAALIFPAITVSDCGFFDEKLGVGEKFGSGEETDYLLRALKKGYSVRYVPEMRLQHPIILKSETIRLAKISPDKVFQYSCGEGALYKKHMIILHEFSLFPIYMERWTKLILKRILPGKKRREVAKAQIKGTILGYHEYK